MFCDICRPQAIEFEIEFSTPGNETHLPSIRRYLNEAGLLIREEGSRLTVREAAVKGLLDYMDRHMDTAHIRFRIDRGEWRPIGEAASLLDAKWIDQIIDTEAVHFHIQPIVDRDGTLYAHEMLARFRSENGEVLSPFPVFEAARTRNRLYALDRVCRMNAVRQSAAVGSRVFINFVPNSIYSSEHCLRSTVLLANELGIDPSRFVFEVVETEKVKDQAHLKRILDYYRKNGFRYALDDIGAGFNTVETIREMKPYYTKLDRQYVTGVHLDPQKQKVALEVLEATRSTGGVPLAEGIEEEAEFRWLKDAGFQLFQGYLFGKPRPIAG
ncbi:EAL domain-containing protein [Bhargavaea cecembensis]|uniref:EAL domain-containing protein n=1 Tax=Bhargavaea cecembensis TaxID=394098 RepID=UPI00058C6D8B|nr:EAL domain-containing protein [Bhargavaea cecembensis]